MVRLSVFEVPESVPAVISGVLGVGAVVSMVILSALEATDVLPALSVWVAVMVYMASERTDELMVTLDALQVPLPSSVAPLNRLTVSPLTHEIVKFGVVVLVTSSVEDVPVSVPAVISGVPGAADAVVSIVMLSVAEVPVLPAVSVWRALIVCAPLVRVAAVIL